MRIVRRLLTLAIAASSLLLSGAVGAAAAEPYPAPSPALTVSASTVTVGDSVQAFGTGYLPNESVSVVVSTQSNAVGPLGSRAMVPVAHTLPLRAPQTVIADANGAHTTTHVLDQVGLATITATGQTSGLSASATVRVLPKGGALPVTGDDGGYLGLLLIGSAVAAAGVVIVVMARSRRRPARIHS